MSFLRTLTQTGNTHLALAIIRIWSGAMLINHGYQKLFVSQADFITYVTTKLQLPEALAWAAMLSEFLGGIALVLGLLTRPAAAFIAMTMAVAVFGTHMHDPWSKKEFALCYLVIGLGFFVAGGGMYSLDAKISQKA